MKNTAALLVVDVQVDVMEGAHNQDQVITTIAELVDRARATSIPVIWVRHSSSSLVSNSLGWQIVPELSPTITELIVEKTFGDSFVDTELAEHLTSLGVNEILLTGALTDFCIRNTFFGALYRGFSVALIADAHTTKDRRSEGMNHTPDEAIRVINDIATRTILPQAQSRLVTATAAI